MDTNSIPDASGIYKITCTVTGKFYIGSAVNLRRRRNHHCNALRSKAHHNIVLQRAWNKHGKESFTFEVIELVLPAFLLEREQHWLDTLKPFDPNGYNIALVAGSHLGTKRSPESRARMRASKLGKSNYKLIGRKASPESRARMSVAQRGKKVSDDARNNMRNSAKNKPPVGTETREKLRIARLGYSHKPETIERIRTANLGKKRSGATRARMSAAKTGKSLSPEHREKLRVAGIGRPMSEKARTVLDAANAKRTRTLIVTDPDGVEHTIHGINQFCKEHNLSQSAIIGVAKGRCSQHKGWQARYPEADVI